MGLYMGNWNKRDFKQINNYFWPVLQRECWNQVTSHRTDNGVRKWAWEIEASTQITCHLEDRECYGMSQIYMKHFLFGLKFLCQCFDLVSRNVKRHFLFQTRIGSGQSFTERRSQPTWQPLPWFPARSKLIYPCLTIAHPLTARIES